MRSNGGFCGNGGSRQLRLSIKSVESFDKLRVTVTQIILVRWDHRIYTGDPILHGDPFDDKAQELLTLVEGQVGFSRVALGITPTNGLPVGV